MEKNSKPLLEHSKGDHANFIGTIAFMTYWLVNVNGASFTTNLLLVPDELVRVTAP